MTISDRILYDPRFEEHLLVNPVLKQDANKISTITFDIYKNNQEYNNISKLKGDIILYCDGDPIMKMRAVYTGETLQGGIKYQLEEMSARLNDIKCRPDYYTGTISQYLSAKISDFNTRNLDDDITFYVGTISGADSDSHTFVNNEYIGYWDLLTKNIAQEYELYLVPRYESNGIYIDCYSEENLPHGSQEIIFGENLVDKFIEKDATDIYTVLIPLGENVKVSNPRPGEATSLPLTIESVNDNKDYLENADGILLYGRKEAIHTWEGVTSASELKTLGQSWLSEHAAQMVKTTTITAVDLRNTDANIESFRWMHRVYVKSDKTNIGEWYTISKCQIPMGNPQKTKIQIGFTEGVFSSFTKDLDEKIKSASGGAGRAMSKAKENEEELKIVFQKTGLNSLGENENLWSLIKANETAIETEVGRATFTEGGIISDVSTISQKADSIELEVQNARQGETDLSAKITVLSNGINSKVSKNNIISEINQSAESITISASKVDISGWLIANEVTVDGLYSHNNIIADGYIQAGAGESVICDSLVMGSSGNRHTASWLTKTFPTGVSITRLDQKTYLLSDMSTYTAQPVNTVTLTTTGGTIYYLGHT